ncbi:hypothetical protein BGX26_010774, partial [Mortierella sp. AD094]
MTVDITLLEEFLEYCPNLRELKLAPEIKDTTLDRYRDFPCPVGGTMGELFDATPKHLISKVLIEEKMFKTCYNSRSVLIGDAWHKFHPAGGQGAQHAIQDAISLANCLYSMKDTSLKSTNLTFAEYYKQRYERNEVMLMTARCSPKSQNLEQTGAQHSIQDVISLANCLYGMKDTGLKSITSTFGEYYSQRYDRNDARFNDGAMFARILNEQ